MIFFKNIFFRNIPQGISIIYANNMPTSNVKTLDMFYCKQRDTLADFSFTFQARTLQYIIVFNVIFFFAILFATAK